MIHGYIMWHVYNYCCTQQLDTWGLSMAPSPTTSRQLLHVTATSQSERSKNIPLPCVVLLRYPRPHYSKKKRAIRAWRV